MSIGISGRVTDFDSGAGVPGASVILVDSSGNATGPGTAADSSGYYSLSDDSVTDPNTWVQFSSVGYFTTRQLASELLSSGNYQMISSSTSLPTATVTATKPTTATPAPTTPTTSVAKPAATASANYTLPVVLGSFAVVSLVTWLAVR